MTTTPQTNATLAQIADVLLAHDDFVVCGHVSPDGDCLGSQLALAAALRARGKRAVCVLVKDEPLDAGLAASLPGADELVFAGAYEGPVGVFVGVDVPTRERIGEAGRALRDRCDLAVTVDHHAVETTMADYVYVDPDSASTTMLVWQLAKLLGVERADAVATCCYVGLVTDTGRFQYQNTDAAAMRAASEMVECGADPASVAREVFQNRTLASVRLEGTAVSRMRLGAGGAFAISWVSLDDFAAFGAVKADAEPLVNALRQIAGVRVACMLREQEEDVRCSFRAKDDTDVSALARLFGGGGHKAAAGCTLHCSLDEAVVQVERVVAEAVAAS